MRHLGSLSAWLCASIAVFGCGRSHLGLEDSVPGFHDSDAQGSANSGAGADDDTVSGSAGATSGGGAGVGGGAAGAAGAAGAPWTDPPSRPGVGPTAGSGVVTGTAGATAGSGADAAGRGAAGAFSGPDNPNASDVLNPQRCATDEPFALTIYPGGAIGEVSGWLESAPSVTFDEHDLPRFGVQTNPMEQSDGDLTLWWSISSLDGAASSAWFYTLNGATEVAYVPVTSPADIGDARGLMYSSWAVGPVLVNELVVFHHTPTDRYLAMQVIDVYGTDAVDANELCAAIRARWYVAPRGSADFSRFR